jgi:hypothetical protein
MDSYIIRIYRRAGRKPRILIGTVEPAGTRRKIAFSNIEELWEILRRPKDRSHYVPSSLRPRLRKEVMSGKVETGLEKSTEGVRIT